ncbi:MAG: ATP cone domain-containing protein [Nitrososphaeria archaeon]|nr:ATP cone domain-containing protein [Nitrososphaeria archaeon]MDW8043922.1 ATP cone domain-containing protein [Nitrososphaerota archaeon]
MVRVQKRDGSEEPFAYEKVVVSCLKAGATLEAARKVAKIVEGRLLERGMERITAKELTSWILELLRKENEEWYRNWIIFDKAVKRRDTEKELGAVRK